MIYCRCEQTVAEAGRALDKLQERVAEMKLKEESLAEMRLKLNAKENELQLKELNFRDLVKQSTGILYKVYSS